MAENEPVKSPLQQTADQVPPEALATPPTFIPELETPEVAALREAEGLPPLPPLKYAKSKGAAQQTERPHATAKK